jgi:hypothetical protein
LPPVDGELAGELNATILGGAPRLKWNLKLGTPKPRERAVEFSVDGYGFRLRGDARLDPMGEGAWRISEAEINLNEWAGWLAPHLAPQVASMSIGGTLAFEGEGTWRGGELGGRARVSLRNGRIDDAKHKVLLEGITCDIEIVDIAKHRTAPAQVLTFTGGHYDVILLGNGRFEFALDGDKATLSRATVSLFGGELSATGVTFSTKRPEFTASAQVSGFDLGQLLFLFPALLSRASGRLDGYVDLTRDSRGIAIGAGFLGLREGQTAELQLHPTPGILSSALPPAIAKVYPGIAKVEREGIPMLAEVLQIRFVPERDELGRSAWIHVAGRPVDPGFEGPIDLMINVRGPLEQVINFGATSALRLMGR